jgi:xylobiose transport system permease protein
VSLAIGVPGPVASARHHRWRPANPVAGAGAALWLVVIGLPLYVLVAATLQRRSEYLRSGPLSVPAHPTTGNYTVALHNGFLTYIGNTVVVTAATVSLVVVLAVPVAYTVVRSGVRLSAATFRLFLLGLAIPAQAVIVPVYLIITQLRLYDTLVAVVLPTAAFALPVCVLILVGSMRDIGEELYEAMAVDGASPARMFFRLVVPLSRAGISTVAVYAALQAWNGFLFPLILTQSTDSRVLTLGLFDYQGQFGVDVPGLMAAVVLSALPIFLVYLVARRALVAGLMGAGGR